MNMQAMMQQAKKLQAEMEKKQAELAKKEFTVEKHGVTIKIMGNRKITSIKVNEFLVDPEDKETLEDLMVVAINDANELISQEEEKLSPQQTNLPF